jgi:hypothetical protein
MTAFAIGVLVVLLIAVPQAQKGACNTDYLEATCFDSLRGAFVCNT